jgi:hypothetical protein
MKFPSKGVTAVTFEPLSLSSVGYKVLISLEREHKRRLHAQSQLELLGAVDTEWKIPVRIPAIPWGILPQAYRNNSKYASHAATLLEVMDETERRRTESFMLIEDDVVFHPNIQKLLPKIRVPIDWKFIYLGGRNYGLKQPVSNGLVRSNSISDAHAVIIRSDIIGAVRSAILDPGLSMHWADVRIASLHKIYPAYLCRPNLAWQSAHLIDVEGITAWREPHRVEDETTPYSNYCDDGTVAPGKGD